MAAKKKRKGSNVHVTAGVTISSNWNDCYNYTRTQRGIFFGESGMEEIDGWALTKDDIVDFIAALQLLIKD